jgi:ribulose-5-phosphate 4-epimerase/fuculose-1-phosphate aldolase
MRGHGVTVVGATLRQVVFRAIYTELNARVQMLAMGIGEVEYLNSAEAAAATSANDGQIERAWNLWRLKSSVL